MTSKVEALKAKIAKLKATIARHEGTKAKKVAKLAKTADENDRYWLQCDIESLDESIAKNWAKVAEAEDKLFFENHMAVKAEKLEARVPAQLKDFRTRLVESWDEHDKAERNAVLEQDEDWWRSGKGTYSAWVHMTELTDERIHEANFKAADSIIQNLVDRVEKAVGSMKSFDRLYFNNGNWMEGTALNGWIEGEKGKVEVRSIHAGGYNIQRLHVRVLVIKMK